jgi:hypothetical protein
MFEMEKYSHPAMTHLKGGLRAKFGGYRTTGVVVREGKPSDWVWQINI